MVREQELQQGKFMGVVRYYKDGALEREYRVNERGNRDGVAREWARAEAGGKSVLVREETLRDGATSASPAAGTRPASCAGSSFYGDGEREQASAEFTAARPARRAALRAPSRPSAATSTTARPAASPAVASNVTLYSGKGVAKGAGLATSAASGERARRSGKAARSRELSEVERRPAASSARSPPTAPSGASSSGRRFPASGRAGSPCSTRSSTRAASWCASAAGGPPSAAPSCSSRRPGT